jgi:hypothetical protein
MHGKMSPLDVTQSRPRQHLPHNSDSGSAGAHFSVPRPIPRTRSLETSATPIWCKKSIVRATPSALLDISTTAARTGTVFSIAQFIV